MEFIEINENNKTVAGEYIYHEPTKRIVMCASFDKKRNVIVFMSGTQIGKDTAENFKKIKLSEKEKRSRYARRRCRSCGR
jgi:hypothetical protein